MTLVTTTNYGFITYIYTSQDVTTTSHIAPTTTAESHKACPFRRPRLGAELFVAPSSPPAWPDSAQPPEHNTPR